MFKKPVEAKLSQRLSGADKKKLRRTVKEKFQHASDANIDEILPPKAEITVVKCSNKVHVYVIEGGLPMLFDIDGRGTEIYPTVYALWKVSELLPSFLLKGGEVSRYVIGGADLMFPGISIPPEGLPSFLAGQPWAVKVPGNPSPIAVGVTTMSSSEALKAGLRGKALRITHYYRDFLWQSAEGHYVPNAGFFEDVVMEDPDSLPVSQPLNLPLDVSNDEDVNMSERETVDILNTNASEVIDSPAISDSSSIQNSEEITSEISGLKVSEKVVAESSNDDKEQQILSTEEIDALLEKCLLQALHTTVKDKDLPMPGSTLWSNHILPCRPAGVTLDIKRSSHKKLSKWLHSKSSKGLISAKEDKYKKEFILLGINRGHSDYMSFKPEKRVQQSNEQKHDSLVSEALGQQTKLQLEVVEVYKPSTHVNSIFTAIGADTGIYYSASEVSDVVFRYVEKENLVKPTDKAIVILDATLCDALYKGTVKKGSTYPTEIHKKDLGATFLSRMQVHHKILKGHEVVIRKGAVKPIQIVTERRQGNKKVTRVSGLETFLLDADSLASELQKKFACSTSVGELPGKKGQHEVLVQGGVIDDLARHLVDHYGIPKRYIEVLDKTKK
ncbi:eukaryotic translation initiation factor 2D-like isoform X1 [Zingiber officinale]|uniref:eukaryotic translation initiation factor 2D-like isoform X1 n=1 Tax=Zingiber officinale TaxID=94328 RepID=UPI001C4B8994|nr:eukaryotic translation initiation factor 2D-like isoform X1 [Zingiber officinale]XP_042463098.1 eukaryotic translation initiation factor 2D-like isoform X1 [Zingiber officinale]